MVVILTKATVRTCRQCQHKGPGPRLELLPVPVPVAVVLAIEVASVLLAVAVERAVERAVNQWPPVIVKKVHL